VDVALFVPCYIDQFYPQVAMATVELLERRGCRVIFPEDQTCCGQPMSNSGFLDDARPLAEKFLRVFGKYDHVVSPSGSCVSMVRNHYQALIGERANSMHGRVFELCEFLHDVLKAPGKGRFPQKVGFHRSCHGLRELRLGSGSERFVPSHDKVKALLAGIEGLELCEAARPDECCGFGGTFAVDEAAISSRMGQDRIREHENNAVSLITGTDTSCLMHLEGLLRREKKPIRVLHVAELLAQAEASA
jgi:L-lactate dehydrogenase complex protein LldE